MLISGLKKRNLLIDIKDVGGKADVKIGQFSVVQSHEGVKSWELVADRAEIFEKDQRALLEKVTVVMQTPQGVQISMEGDSGSVDTGKKDFYIEKKEGLLTVQLSNGYIIKTPALSWFNDQRLIVSKGPAHITGPQVEIDGNELRFAPDNQEVTVSGHVQALVR